MNDIQVQVNKIKVNNFQKLIDYIYKRIDEIIAEFKNRFARRLDYNTQIQIETLYKQILNENIAVNNINMHGVLCKGHGDRESLNLQSACIV